MYFQNIRATPEGSPTPLFQALFPIASSFQTLATPICILPLLPSGYFMDVTSHPVQLAAFTEREALGLHPRFRGE